MPPNDSSQHFPDAMLAGSLVTAPAWSPWLTQLNQLLTTATLVVGLTLGCARLWLFFRKRCKQAGR